MRYLPAYAGLAAALISSGAMANDPAPSSVGADLHLAGMIQSACSMTFGSSPEFTVDLDLGAQRPATQNAGEIAFGCNSPYKVSLTARNGRLINRTAEATDASNRSLTIGYGVSFTGNMGPFSVNRLDHNAVRSSASNPQLIALIADWRSLENNGKRIQAGIQIFPDYPSGNGVAGFYTDTLEFTITAEL
jgi:spore coat protein U-like protein